MTVSRRLALLLALAAVALALPALPVLAEESAAKPLPDPKRWEAQVEAFEKQDAEKPQPDGVIVFVGSSTIRMWKGVSDDFKPLNVIGRGIGGCIIPDTTHYAERLVLKYKPSQVVFYAGDNDTNMGRKAPQVLADFQAFCAKIHEARPGTPIHFMAIKPSPSRARIWDEVQRCNAAVREWAEKQPCVTYLDTAAPMLDAQGKVREDIFLKDMLHLNAEGYKLYVPIIKAALEKAAKDMAEKKAAK
jgi:lysophospholipase L1-like esterase